MASSGSSWRRPPQRRDRRPEREGASGKARADARNAERPGPGETGLMRRLIVLVVVLGLGACTGGSPPAPGPDGSAGPGWRRLADAPSERTEVAAAAAGKDIAVVGGYLGSGPTVSTVEVLDTETG